VYADSDEWDRRRCAQGQTKMQNAEFPSCLRFSLARDKLEKSRKPSSPASACLSPAQSMNRHNAPVLAVAALARTTAMRPNQTLPSLDVDRIFRLLLCESFESICT
jgi:hypothetical protein